LGLRRIARLVRYFFTFTHLHLHSTPSFAFDTSADVERKLSGAPHHRRRWVAAYPPAQHRTSHRTPHFAIFHHITLRIASHRIASHFANFAKFHRITLRIASHRIAPHFALHRIASLRSSTLTPRHSFTFQLHSDTYSQFIHSFINTLASSRLRGEDSTPSPSSFIMLEETSQAGGTSTTTSFLRLDALGAGECYSKMLYAISTLQHFGSHH
jgi:hypothetical protein